MTVKEYYRERLHELKNWTMIDNMAGYYRYVIAAKVAYEIFVTSQVFGESDINAIANVYITGKWNDSKGKMIFDRELIASGRTVGECLEKVVEDYEENMI